MPSRRTLLAASRLTAATWLALAPVSIASAQTFRLGDQPYRFVEDAPGQAYTRTTPTPSAYFRPTITGDDQVGRLAGQLDQHLKMSYRHDASEYNRRYVHFRNVMDEWDKSPKGVDQQVQMTQWLKTSIKYSMPGSHDFLPPMPRVNPIDQESDSTRSPGVRDPFRDDPVQTAPL
jgi:hypothetical protein